MSTTKNREENMTPIPPRKSRQQAGYVTEAPDIAEDERYYITRQGTSVRRYQSRTTEGRPVVKQQPATQHVDEYGRPVMQQGNRRYVMVQEQAHPKRRFHWLMWAGLVMLLMLFGWILLSAFGNWWTDWRNYSAYGNPRTYQTDAVVGHNDSSEHPSHFLFMNWHTRVVVIEFPGGNTAQAMIYTGPQLLGNNSSGVPVTGQFTDTNGDGKPDMEIDYAGNSQIWLNNGTKFVPPGS